MLLIRSFIILILISLTMYPQTQTTLKDLGTLSSKTSTVPVVFNGSATYKNYVYVVGLGKVYIYNESDPKNPTYINTISIYSETGGARRVWVGENYLFVYTGYRIKIYDLTNPESPLLKSDYFSGEDLHKVSAKGNYMFVLYMTDQKYGKAGSLEIVDISNPSSVQLKGTYKPSNYEGRSFSFSATENRIFVAHYENLSKKGYIREIDYSDPNMPLQVRELIVDGAPIEISVSGNTLFMLKDGGWTGPSKLEAYNLATSSISVLSSLQVSTERAWDMHVYGNSITTTLLENNGIKDYTWNSITKTFDAGQLLNIPLASQMSWFVVSTQTSNSISNLKKTAGGYWIYIYYYIVEKTSNSPESEVYGITMRLIEKAVWIEEPDVKVSLITSIFPPEASADGCTVTPAGTNQFDKNSNATLDASAGAGWVWDKWSGSLSGSVKPQQLKMDDDKNVVGNFQPILVLSLSSHADDYLCPPELNEELTIATANIFVDGVDWMLSGISFTVEERFKPNYSEAWIEYSGTKLKGIISTDADGYATSISFSPSKQIDEGNTLAVRLFYKFNYPSTAKDVRKYKISIHVGQVECVPIPVSARPGVKGPSNIIYSNTQTVAFVWNVSKNPRLPFASIQEAINDPATVNGNIIELCPNTYKENVLVTKELTIKSAKGKEVTIVEAVDLNSRAIVVLKNNTTIKDLIIRRSGSGIYAFGVNNLNVDNCNVVYNVQNGMLFFDINGGSIKNCVFTQTAGIKDGALSINGNTAFTVHNCTFTNNYYAIYAGGKFTETYLSSNQINLATKGIYLSRSVGCNVFNNSIQNCSESGIEIMEGNNNRVEENTVEPITSGYSSSGIILLRATGDIIKNNTINKTILGIDAMNGILVMDSKNFTITGNKIYNNFLASISIDNSSDFEVLKNKCYGNGVCIRGVLINDCKNFNVAENRIFDFNMKQTNWKYGGFGIHLIGNNSNGWLTSNLLSRNCTGINLEDSYTNIKILLNFVMDSFCFLTGIHMSGGEAEISGNYISGNRGAGIMTENGARAKVSYNNFINNEKAIINNDALVTINASSNYWGASQPSSSDYSGNVTITSWLSSAVSLVSSFMVDTLYVKAAQSDSVTFAVQNLDDKLDEVQVTLSDEKGWILGSNTRTVKMIDSTGAVFRIGYSIPTGLIAGVNNWIKAQVISTKHPGAAVKDSVLLTSYNSVIEKILLSPDSASIKQGNTLQTSFNAYDNKNYLTAFTPQWTVSAGTISETGLYNSTGVSGVVTITATHQASGKNASVKIYVSAAEPTLKKIKINPTSITMNAGESNLFTAVVYDQINFIMNYNCVWTSTDGTIASNGFFYTSSTTKNCTVKASDSTGAVFAVSNVIINPVTSVTKEKSIPNSFMLEQNYPNPFNPTTTIRFALPKNEYVSLKVYDILGREVGLLANEVKSAGNYEVRFNGSKLSSGVYFYQLRAGNFVQTKKFLLLK